MPNGNSEISDAEWANIKAFFAKLSATLSAFATRHNLAIVEYYHEGPAWSFRFQHPKGGGATIHVERVNDSTVAISGSWYVDEYETFTRYSMLGPRHDCILGNTDLRKELDACLTEVIDWQKQDLVPNAGYKKIWSRYSKEDWSEYFSTSKLPRLSL